MDAGTLEAVLAHIHNWFVRESITSGGCQISDGQLPASVTDRMLEGQWYRIEGSYLNDGLHLHPADDLNDETFDATISLLAIPRPLLAICEDIQAYLDDCREARQTLSGSVYQSESFGGYSYSLRGDLTAGNASGGLTGWQAQFSSQLNPWRKMY